LKKPREKAILVGIATRDVSVKTVKEHLAELGRLAETAGADVVETTMQRMESLNPSTLVGEGKVGEIAGMVERHKADLVIFDEDLSGSQVKKLESAIATKILDRSGIILDIFARHARTAEAKVQVELAQLEYMLPRLTKAWTHLSRQAGGVGIGMKGPGETQLETDRRLVRKRIADLSRKLEKLEGIREAQHRHRAPTFHVALVGYTNAGKSTLMNALTRAGVESANKLFATLDPTTRKIYLGPKKMAVLSDTVGFIRKLPVGLVFQEHPERGGPGHLDPARGGRRRRRFRGPDGGHRPGAQGSRHQGNPQDHGVQQNRPAPARTPGVPARASSPHPVHLGREEDRHAGPEGSHGGVFRSGPIRRFRRRGGAGPAVFDLGKPGRGGVIPIS
jgi:GTPase